MGASQTAQSVGKQVSRNWNGSAGRIIGSQPIVMASPQTLASTHSMNEGLGATHFLAMLILEPRIALQAGSAAQAAEEPAVMRRFSPYDQACPSMCDAMSRSLTSMLLRESHESIAPRCQIPMCRRSR